MRERLKSNLSEKVIHYLFEHSIEGERNRSFETMIAVNKAHLCMLVSEQIITKEVGTEILHALNAITEGGSDRLEINPNLEDLYFNIEADLIKRVGVGIAGQLHTGRSRNDLYITVTRMTSRQYTLQLCSLIMELRYTLLNLAEEKSNIVMTGYTHMQPAEPITLGHYFSGILHALERDFYRLMFAFQNTNHSPLGSGAMASTSFPINRKQTARLLGFADTMGNSLDGVASRDFLLEALSAMNIFMNNISRLTYDLYIWSTDEYALVEVGDSVAVSSSIMPQKKNPITLEHMKAKSAHVLGELVSMTSSMKNTPFGHSRDIAAESHKGFWESVSEVEATISLTMETIKSLKFNEDRMLSRAMNNFCTVTELANMLVREVKISFREAHQIVGYLVNQMIESNIKVTDINPELINDASYALLNKEVLVSIESIQKAINPITNVELKNVEGGPAPLEVISQLKVLRDRADNDQKWLEGQMNGIAKRKEILSNMKIQ